MAKFDKSNPDLATDSNQASLELFYHVSQELAKANDLRSVLQRVLSLCLGNIGGERGSIIVLDDDNLPVEATIMVGKQVLEHSAAQLKEIVERGLAGWVIRNLKPVLVPDTSKDNRWLRRPDDAPDQSGAKSAICVPLLARERLVGILTIVHKLPGSFTDNQLFLIRSIADMAGITVMNARLFDESQRQARVMTILAENTFMLNTSLRLDLVLQSILDKTAHAMQAEDVLLGLYDEAHHDFVIQAATGHSSQVLLGYRFPLGHGIAGRVAKNGKGVIIPAASRISQAQLPGLEVQSAICVPISVRSKTIGVLEAVNSSNKNLDSEALLVMTGIGSLAAVAIQNAQLYEQLETAHRRYRELFESSIDPILITDLKGKVVEGNRQAILASGYDQETLKQINITDLHKIDTGKLDSNFSNLSNADTVTYESNLVMESGTTIPVDVYVQPIKIMEQESHIQWIFRDISIRKALLNLQDDLITMVYHDLRSPLANLVTSLDMLKNFLPDEKYAELNTVMAIAYNSTNRLQRLVNSLLDIRGLESGLSITHVESVSPYTLVKESMNAVNFVAGEKHQELKSVLPEGLPNVMVDADMIRRVLINLIENACKFTPTKGKIEVGALPVGPWVQMWIKDNGAGISQADQEHIFEKFSHSQPGTAPKGLGLGLAYCKLAINAHKGKIWVISQPKMGSQFFFTLPIAERKV